MSMDTGTFGPSLAAEGHWLDPAVPTRCHSRSATQGVAAPEWQPEAWFTDVLDDAGLTQRADVDSERVDVRTIKVLRDHRRPIVAGDLLESDGNRRRVVVKTYRDDRGATTLQLLRRLGDAGLGTGPFTVTAGLGWSSCWRALVTAEASGAAWSDLFLKPVHELALASAAVGAWLRIFQTLSLDADEPGLLDRSHHCAGLDMIAKVETLGKQYPRARRRLALLSQQALVDLTAAADEQLVPSHGDLHPHNVRVRRDGSDLLVTALDLDRLALRCPSYDVGHAVAQLLIMSERRCRSFVPGALAAQSFLMSICGGVEPPSALNTAVGAEVTRALLYGLYKELVALVSGRLDLLPACCAVAEAILSDGVAEVLPRLAGGRRP